VGDVVGTGSSRKSATNSVIWATGQDIPFVPNKRFGGVTLGGKIAPIFYNTQEDSGALPIEVDVSNFEMGDVIDIFPYEGTIQKDGQVAARFALKSDVLFDEVRAGGRINLIIGRSLTANARAFLGLTASTTFRLPKAPGSIPARATRWRRRWSAAPAACRKARACAPAPTASPPDHRRQPGHHRPDDPRRAEGPGLPGLLADLVMQSFCHTAPTRSRST
jgi:aconitate hydratase 2/2-methylisocitrate dehydratase